MNIYYFNGAVVINHDGDNIFVDVGYEGGFNDASVLRGTDRASEGQEKVTTDPE